MKIIKLGLVVLFLFSISNCSLLDSDIRRMINAYEEGNIDEKIDYSSLTEHEQCLVACNDICNKINVDECKNSCETNCSIFTVEPAIEVSCDNGAIEKKCTFVDESKYVQAKDEIAKKCDLEKDPIAREKCFAENLKWLMEQDFAQQKCEEIRVAGKCYTIAEEVCKEVTKEVIIDEVKCKEMKTIYEKSYAECKMLKSDEEIKKCIELLNSKMLADVDKACATTKIVAEECNKDAVPFNKVNLKCTEEVTNNCKYVDQATCDEAYKKLPFVIEENCGPKPAVPDLKYEECYAAVKAKLIIPACTQSCETISNQKKYSVELEQIAAYSKEEAINLFLNSLKVEPECTKQEVVEKPIEEPVVPQPEPEKISLSPVIYSGDMFVYVGDTAGCSTAISGLDYNFDWKCSWYMAVAGSDEFKLIPDQNNCSYIIDSVKLELNGSRYFFTVTNADKTVKSNVVTLFVK